MCDPRSHARQLGAAVEAAACGFLSSLGYEVMERNYSCRFGEIDIVALEAGVLVFVEVRYRGLNSRESAGESLGWRKLERLRRAVRHYLMHRRVKDSTPVRVDACLGSPATPRGGEAVPVPGLGFVRFQIIRGAVDFH
ncbi:MAG: YraN family protein [Bacillota bacterium]|jgi:putative endonuclease